MSRLRRAWGLSSSVGDSALSAAASFLVGLIALRTLSTNELALYALLLAAGLAAMALPQQMAFLPRRIQMNNSAVVLRSSYRADLRLSSPYMAVAVVITVTAGLPLVHTVDLTAALLMMVGAAAWVCASSFQDHVRTSLHVTGRHSSAFAVSAVQLGISGGGFLLSFSGVGTSTAITGGLPFAVLAISNVVSAAVGVIVHRRMNEAGPTSPVSVWLGMKTALSGFLLQSMGYVMNLVVALFIGSAALADLEGARIAAQPILVAGTAMASYFLPAAVRSQFVGDFSRVRKATSAMILGQVAMGIAYVVVLPLLVLVLDALTSRHINTGLAAARVGSFTLQSTVAPLNQLNMAGGRYAAANLSTAASVCVSISVLLLTIGPLQVYSVPVSAAAGAMTRLVVMNIRPRRSKR